jgi:geranylgeranyl transferase type-2 subunit beta
MGHASYLLRLLDRIRDGVAQLPMELRGRQADYLRASQNADGGFSGRENGSDLYYTGFALRGLAVLDALSPDVVERAAGFLLARLRLSADTVDFFSLLYSCLLVNAAGGPDVLADAPPDWPERVAVLLESFRTPDGGYGKSAGAASASTYQTFLVGLSYELLGRSLPQPEEAIRFVASRRREDGGYVEVAPMRRSGTNPTAAAVGILQLAQGRAFAPTALTETADFLAALASPEGGLRANTRAPLADLLSTFTGLWTLEQLKARDRLDLDSLRAYVRALEQEAGGFRGGLWDERADVEYTFYGLGVLALCEPADKA